MCITMVTRRNHSGLMEELLDKYPTALEIIHSHLEGKAESDSPKSAQPADAEVKTQPKTANGGEEAAHPHAELRSMLSNIFQNPILTKKLVETNPAMIAQLFRSVSQKLASSAENKCDKKLEIDLVWSTHN